MRAESNFILIVLIFILSSSSFAQIQGQINQKTKRPFDKKIDVGGYSLHLNCSKFIRKSPTVVFEAGLNQGAETWDKVKPETAEFARACVYDRAGLGKSDVSPQPLKTSLQIVNDLHILLEKSGVNPPFVLVGHSFGGLIVRLFAAKYPAEVAGMVLVDAVHEEESQKWLEMIPTEIREKLESLGGQQLLGSEAINFNESMIQMRSANWQTDIPLTVLARGKASYNPEDYPPLLRSLAPKGEELRIRMQKDLATRSTKSKFIFAEKSGHFIQQDEPELVIESIRQVVEATKSKSKIKKV